MAPHQRASIRSLTVAAISLNVVSIAALPQHHHPCPSHNALVARDALANDVPVTLNSKSDPKNFVHDLVDFLGNYSPRDLLRMWFGELLGGDDDESSTTIVPSVTPVTVTGVDLTGESTTIGLQITGIFVVPTPVASIRVEASASASAQAGVSASVTIPVPSVSTIPISFSVPTVSVSTSSHSRPPIVSWIESLLFDFFGPDSSTAVPTLTSVTFPIPTASVETIFPTLTGLEPTLVSIPVVTAPTIPVSVVSEISGLPEANGTTSEIIFSILPWPPFETPKYPNVTISKPTIGTAGVGTILPIPTGFATSRRDTTHTVLWPPTGTGVRLPSGTGYGLPGVNTTIRIKSTKYLTVTATVLPVEPSLVTGLSGVSVGIPSTTGVVRWPNITFVAPTIPLSTGTVFLPSVPLASSPSINATLSILTPTPISSLPGLFTIPPNPLSTSLPFLIPLPTPYINTSDTAIYAGRLPLREVCSSTSAKTITLPLLDLFYGPYAYPSLHSFPGCTAPNPSQALRAPGLLNCTDLGQEVLACQRLGRQVLLSVKGSGAGAVGGNLEYGKPGVSDYPFGAYFPHNDNGTVNASASASVGATVTVERSPHPNLFDESHPPSALALTLFSLFGEGHTERADLRPLGDEDAYVADPDINWFAKPLGEEVVVDGFDVQVPSEWKGTYQGERFGEFTGRLRELVDEAWKETGGDGADGGPVDLGSDGEAVVLSGFV
ncbi:hypothetical protein BDV96DRAFT_602555 [Lophiotrema nucula]|uniref:Uncharacterized protein n=1 Tax=Lophiotrema nucula TaxID=690887 RepID=A0A6A5YY76_9PLEO|nr:hypothetical protein BDV96DRAFT_602555 [Lophiotrema nucula]